MTSKPFPSEEISQMGITGETNDDSGASSDLELYDTDDELERLQISESCHDQTTSSRTRSLERSGTPDPLPENVAEHPAVKNEFIIGGSEPLSERAKFKCANLKAKRLDMDLYVPLGSLTFNPERNAKVPDKWKESIYAPDCLPEDHPSFVALGLLLGFAWIRIFTRRNRRHSRLATLRVYILPDDVGLKKLPKRWRRHRTTLKTLLGLLDTTADAWNRRTGLSSQGPAYHPESEEKDSLFYIFNTLSSPRPDSSGIEDPFAKDAVQGLIERQPVTPGLKTELHPYQYRSAAMMIQREVKPARMLDPRLELFMGPTGQTLYFDREASMFYSQRREYDEARGGILAETMGYGKTLICLAVILQTKGHWPRVPPEFLECLPPWPNVGSLMDMAARAANQAHIPWKSYFEQLSRHGDNFEKCVQHLEKNVANYEIPNGWGKVSARVLESRSMKHSSKEPVRLCSTTLIIVPRNLISQWVHEIKTHLDEDCINFLVLDDLRQKLPSAARLQQFDIILISRSRFERECSEQEDTKYLNTRYRSPLRDLHFLRLIVDEGHNFCSSNNLTRAGNLLEELHVERKWIVSGTPSSGLFGAEVDTAASETSNEISRCAVTSNQEALAGRREDVARAQERKDLAKLGNIVTDFLGVHPWSWIEGELTVSWEKYIVPSRDGVRKPASLRSTLESLVVRHCYEDIEADLQLPPLHNRVVHLEPGYFDVLSINLFVMVITVNAITSERTDQDYMFHPTNRTLLEHLVGNLRISGFYWTGFVPQDVANTIKVSWEYLRNPDKIITSVDQETLETAIRTGEACLNSPAWRAYCTLAEMGLYLENFPHEASSGWALGPGVTLQPLLIGATHVQRAQQHVRDDYRHGSRTASRIIADLLDAGSTAVAKTRVTVARKRSARTELDKMVLAQYESRRRGIGLPDSTILASNNRVIGKLARYQGKPSSNQAEDLMFSIQQSISENDSKWLRPLPSDSPLARTRLIGTASAKLSYLLDQVVALHRDEKILIFYRGDHIAWYITQCLEVMGIEHLIYSQGTKVARRNAYVEILNSTKKVRVLLMDLHQASHGLHIASASRVFFVNPVWQPNVEAQAIKRAHRIGQTRPVYVETLVLKGTIEEQLLQRRKEMTNQEHQEAKNSPLDDSAMNEIIKNATFIPLNKWDNVDAAKQMVPLKYAQPVFERASNTGNAGPNHPDTGPLIPLTMNQPTQVPKRKVRFTDDQNKSPEPTENSPKRRKSGGIASQAPVSIGELAPAIEPTTSESNSAIPRGPTSIDSRRVWSQPL